MIVITKEVIAPVPAGRVFAVLSDALRLMQLRSDWGVVMLEAIAPDFPTPGSGFTLRHKDEPDLIDVTVEEMRKDERLVLSCKRGVTTQLTWTLHSHEMGCRLQLDQVLATDDEAAVNLEEEQSRSWLENIKNYAALENHGWQGGLRWLLERHVLKLRAEQRRTILILVALQIGTFLTFVAALIGLGLASLIASWFKG